MAGMTIAARQTTQQRLLLADGRDAQALDLMELWKAISPIVPGITQDIGKAALLAAYEHYVWAGLIEKLGLTERALLGVK